LDRARGRAALDRCVRKLMELAGRAEAEWLGRQEKKVEGPTSIGLAWRSKQLEFQRHVSGQEDSHQWFSTFRPPPRRRRPTEAPGPWAGGHRVCAACILQVGENAHGHQKPRSSDSRATVESGGIQGLRPSILDRRLRLIGFGLRTENGGVHVCGGAKVAVRLRGQSAAHSFGLGSSVSPEKMWTDDPHIDYRDHPADLRPPMC